MTRGSKRAPGGLRQAEDLLAEAAGDVFERIGKRRLLGRVWALVFLSGDALDAEDLRHRANISAGSLSMALNELVDMGLVTRETQRNERRFYYRCETEMWTLITAMFRRRVRPKVLAILEKVKEAGNLLEGDESPQAAFALQQMRHLDSLGTFTLDVLDAFTERTKVEVKAAQKWLSVSGKLGGEPLSRLRKRINAARGEKKS